MYKNEQTFRHDLFRLREANLKANKSWKYGVVQLEEFPHVHFFHSFDSAGRPQQYSTPSAGHFHEIKWHVDEDGNFKATCGPAKQYKYVKRGGTQKKIMSDVAWHDDERGTIVDNHTHDVEYRWSEELSKDLISKKRNALTQQAAHQMQVAAMAQSMGVEGAD